MGGPHCLFFYVLAHASPIKRSLTSNSIGIKIPCSLFYIKHLRDASFHPRRQASRNEKFKAEKKCLKKCYRLDANHGIYSLKASLFEVASSTLMKVIASPSDNQI